MQECQDALEVSFLNLVRAGSYPFCQKNDQEVGRPSTRFFGGQATRHPTNGGTE